MSIINEALKKAGQPVLAEGKKNAFQPELLKRKNRINWGPLFVVAVLILITAPILAPIFKDLSSEVPDMSPVVSADNRKGQFAVEEIPLTPMARPAIFNDNRVPPKFSMTGLIYSEGGSYCLINGKVLKVGESVGGAALISVTPTEAVLKFQGEKIVLHANS